MVLSVTLTANGGKGGGSMSARSTAGAATGGAAGTGASNANLIAQAGSPGMNGILDSNSIQVSGAGGSSPMGTGAPGSQTNAAGAAGTGFGAGGAGGTAVQNTTDKAGGAGTAGAWIVYEYT